MSREQDKEVYLGDGLYAQFDGHGINLRAPRHDGDHWVYLEPETYESLIKFVDDLQGVNNHCFFR